MLNRRPHSKVLSWESDAFSIIFIDIDNVCLFNLTRLIQSLSLITELYRLGMLLA